MRAARRRTPGALPSKGLGTDRSMGSYSGTGNRKGRRYIIIPVEPGYNSGGQRVVGQTDPLPGSG